MSSDFVLNHKTGCFTYLFWGKTLKMQPQIGRVKHCKYWMLNLPITRMAAQTACISNQYKLQRNST
ncbi:hypothetical protein AR688_19265 [Rheinheimera sp. EpRS3]|nr:hypothetical protein AR688_19265 [Rheinheimera sp. EpRS3]